jgi:hypothetical protein
MPHSVSLKQGAVYEVSLEDDFYYQLKNSLCRWEKIRFVEVKNAAGDPLEQPKYVRCIDSLECDGKLHYGTIYQVFGETDNDYILVGVHLSWDKDRFETVPHANKDASMPEPRTNKYVRCIQDVVQDPVRWVQLNAGSVYQVSLETDHHYNLVGIDYPWSKWNFIEVPKPKKVYQHSRKQIINQLKDLSNTLVGRATFGRVHSLEEHEDAVLEVRDDLDLIISYLEQLKETD